MATDPMLDRTQDYSINHFTGTGTTGPFELNFAGGYIRQEQVKAYITNGDGSYTLRTITFTGPNTVTTDVAIPIGTVLTVYRDTPKDGPAVSFTDGAIINEPNLDTLAKQAVFAAAEMVDRFAEVADQSAEAHATADSALTASANAITTADEAEALAATASTAAAAAQTAAAASASAASAAAADAATAQTAAAASQAHADTALSTANTAATDAATAISTANTAVTTANTASTNASAAVTTANSASAAATGAVSTANTASTTATDAKTEADNTASQFASLQATVNSFVGDPTQYLQKGNNLSELTNVTTARSNLGLSNVENKSSGTIRGELSSANVTTALTYTPVNKAGDTVSGTLGVATPTSSGHAATKGYVDDAVGRRNRIINGDMRIDQRQGGVAVSVGNTAKYTIDRWGCHVIAATTTATVQQTAIAWTGCRATKALRYKVAVAQASLAAGEFLGLYHLIEGVNVTDLQWGTAAAKGGFVDFWASPSVTGTYCFTLGNSAGNRNFTHEVALTANTPTRVAFFVPGDTSGTWLSDTGMGLQLEVCLGVGSTFQTATKDAWQAGKFYGTSAQTNLGATLNATMDITDVQFVATMAPVEFERRAYADELRLCQRYFQRYQTAAIAYNVSGLVGAAYPVTMRAAPTVVINSTSGSLNNHDVRTTTNGVVVDMGPLTPGAGVGGMIYLVGTATGLTVGASYDFWLQLDAEL